MIVAAAPALLDAVADLGVRPVPWEPAQPLRDLAPGGPDVVVLPNVYLPREVYRQLDLPNLRLVQLSGAGFERALRYLPAHLTVCNARGVHDPGTAELAVGLALAAQRGIDVAARNMLEGRWQGEFRPALAGRRVLILGYGSVGAAVARRLEAFDAEVVKVARTAREDVHGVAELPELLPQVDIVIVTTPLTEETRGLLDTAMLAAMPDGALLVNVGRGKVVDTEALLAEVSSGRLRAALDVTDPEPLPPEHPLWHAPGVLITPHVGGHTDSATPRLIALVRRQIAALRSGGELVNVVRQGSS